MESLIRDLRYVARGLTRSPGFFAVTIVTLALGIGATTAIFSVIYGVLLQPLPYPQPDRIVQMWQVGAEGQRMQNSDLNFKDWREQTRSFASMAQYSAGGPTSVSGPREPVRARVASVSGNFFDVLGVPAAGGRLWAPDELRENGTPAAVVSYRFWQQNLGGNPAILGTSLKIGTASYAIIGVMPEWLDFPAGAEIWVPKDIEGTSPYRTGHNWRAIARLKEGASFDQARNDISAVSKRLKQQYGDETWMSDATIVPLRDEMVGKTRPALLVLLAAAAFLLLIACANVVNLLVARMAVRQGEVALRIALGAGRMKLVQQFLTESLVLALAGGLLGVLLATVGMKTLLALDPGNLPRAGEVKMSIPVLLFALGVSVTAAVSLGLIAALRGTSGDVREALASAQRTQTGAGNYGIRSVLVVAQVALTIILLIGVGLLGRSFLRLMSVNPGFRTNNVVVLDVRVPGSLDSTVYRRNIAFYDDLLSRLSALPGVRAVGGVNAFPLAAQNTSNGVFIVMSSPTEKLDMSRIPDLMRDPARAGQAEFRVASPGYFKAMNIPLVRGRLFDDRDAPSAPHVAVISQSLVKEKWPNEDPIGKIIQFGNMDGDLRPFTVVGIVGDVREASLAEEPRPTFYAFYRQRPIAASSFNVAIQGDAMPATVTANAQQIARELRPDVPPRVRTLETVVATSVADRRFMLVLIGVFGSAALLLAALGVYSVIAYLVAQRKQEIGIRVALGAQRTDVLRMVLGQGAMLAGIGIMIGVGASLALTRLLNAFLFGVSTTDPLAFVLVIAVLVLVALLASWIPARRAARVDPMSALRGS